jgi:hypothetical protein
MFVDVRSCGGHRHAPVSLVAPLHHFQHEGGDGLEQSVARRDREREGEGGRRREKEGEGGRRREKEGEGGEEGERERERELEAPRKMYESLDVLYPPPPHPPPLNLPKHATKPPNTLCNIATLNVPFKSQYSETFTLNID